MSDKLLEVSMMLGDAIEKLNSLSAYKPLDIEDRLVDLQADVEELFDIVKPKEKKKLYLWAYQDKVTKSWKLTDRFMESAEDVEQDYRWIDNFYRIDNSMIEVEDEPI